MPIKRTYNSGLGQCNQTFPLWELGCRMYWRSSNPMQVQQPGGSGIAIYSYTELADDYYIYDQGKGHFRKVTVETPEFPSDGFCCPDRQNLWDGDNSDRGFNSFGTDVTHAHPVIVDDYILDPVSTGLTDMLQVTYTGATSGQFSRGEALNATLNRIFSIWMKRSDGGVIDGSFCKLFIAAAHGAKDENAATYYRKARKDGWYQLSTLRAFSGTTTTYKFGITLLAAASGIPIYVEMPQLDGANVHPQWGVLDAPNIGTEDNKGIHQLDIASHAESGAIKEPFMTAGWIGASIMFPYDSDECDYPLGWVINQMVDSSNYITLETSSTQQHIVGAAYVAAASTFFLNPATNRSIAANEKCGVVLTWGRRSTTDYAILFMNGQMLELDTNWSLPTGVPTKYMIGYDPVDTREPAVCIQEIGIGRGLLSRSEGMVLSKWFQNRVLDPSSDN